MQEQPQEDPLEVMYEAIVGSGSNTTEAVIPD